MVTKLQLTKQISDKRVEVAALFPNTIGNEEATNRMKEILVEINQLKVQLEKLEEA